LIKIWDAKNLACIKTIDAGHKNRIWSITYSKNGNRLATASSDITIKVWNMVLF
jgi:WD40 repeat protein